MRSVRGCPSKARVGGGGLGASITKMRSVRGCPSKARVGGGGLGASITKMRSVRGCPSTAQAGGGSPGTRTTKMRPAASLGSSVSATTGVYDPVFEPFDSARSLILSLAVTRPCPAARRTFAVERSAVAVARWTFSFVRTLSKAVLSWS